jgi:hypothetical protein
MGPCWKRGYPTVIAARRAIQLVKQSDRSRIRSTRARHANRGRRDDSILAPYVCQNCGSYHIGHSYPQLNKRKKEHT